jgi:hypothetical protein
VRVIERGSLSFKSCPALYVRAGNLNLALGP